MDIETLAQTYGHRMELLTLIIDMICHQKNWNNLPVRAIRLSSGALLLLRPLNENPNFFRLGQYTCRNDNSCPVIGPVVNDFFGSEVLLIFPNFLNLGYRECAGN